MFASFRAYISGIHNPAVRMLLWVVYGIFGGAVSVTNLVARLILYGAGSGARATFRGGVMVVLAKVAALLILLSVAFAGVGAVTVAHTLLLFAVPVIMLLGVAIVMRGMFRS